MRRSLASLIPLLALLIPAAVFAQGPAALQTVRGRVLDPSGAPIARARITAAPRGRSLARTVLTTERGEFRFDLPEGEYTLTVAADGFLERRHDLTVTGPLSSALDFVLQLSSVQEQVDVTGRSGYQADWTSSATRTPTALRDVPQSVTVITQDLMRDQLMQGMADVVRYVPGIAAHQGENNRDDVVIRGNRSSADFFVNGVRDDVQYFRDLYNLERVEALKGPNALSFGRGGGGGVLNRVVKEPLFRPLHNVTLEAGAEDHKRVTADFNRRLTSRAAVRANGMVQQSGSFRQSVDLERAAFNPTLTFSPAPATRFTAGYEYLRDDRVADRGITSVDGRPAEVDRSTFYGDPAQSAARARVHIGSLALEQAVGDVRLKNRTAVAHYDRFYQNFVPGAVSADRQLVPLSAYNNATDRTNVFNQTDVTWFATTGRVRHTLLAGAEVGRQLTDNFRQTGFFNNTASSFNVPFDRPTVAAPLTFRQNATDADNHVRANVAALFVQDQIGLTSRLDLLAGLRADRFDLRFENNRTAEVLSRTDNLVSPRAGLVFKAADGVSLYGSYSVSHLPSSGDQFSSLTSVTQQVKPERFNNYEAGAKWDAAAGLSVTGALYRLDRTNTRATDPDDPTRIVQTGSQRTNGFELGVNGQITRAWRITGGYAFQDAFVTSVTTAAPQGAIVGQVPRHTFSLWNNYQLHPRAAAAVGIVQRSDMFATISDTVTLPGYVRVDAAGYLRLARGVRLQVNIENLTDEHYFANADSNTNISPGLPRTLRVALATTF